MTPAHLKELFEERAAIMQFDGKLKQIDAEWEATEDIKRSYAYPVSIVGVKRQFTKTYTHRSR